MKCFANNGGEISRLANQVIVLHARTRDAHRVNFLKRVGADQVFRNLAGYYDDRRRIHVSIRDSGDGIGGAWTRGDEHDANGWRRVRLHP